MRFDRRILSVIPLLCALAWTLWFVFAGFGNHQDPLYWLYKYEHLEGGWLAAGALLTGGVIVKLFGAQLLPLRLAGWACVVTAIALPYCCLLDREQRRSNLHWLALTFCLMGYGAFQEFSPGTLSVLLLSLLWVTQSPIVLGLAVAVRFPNILALLILIPLWRKRSLWNIPIAAVTAGIVYLLGYWLITPAVMDTAMTSHDIFAMLTKLWENGGKLIGFMILAVGVLAIGEKIKQYQSSITRYPLPIFSLFVSLALVYFALYAFNPFQWYNTDLTYCISALVLVIAGYSYILNRTPNILIGAAILVVATLGTDTAWLKLFPAVLCLLPIAAVQYEPSLKRYLFIVVLGLTAVAMMRMSTNSVGQSNLTKATTIASVAPYQGIAIRGAEQNRLQQYKQDYQLLNDSIHRPILAVGQENHLMRAVTGCEAARFNEFWSNIFDSVYTARYREIIQTERPIVFCSFSPQFKTKPVYQDKQSRMENMLLEQGYTAIDRSQHKYMIYIPQENRE